MPFYDETPSIQDVSNVAPDEPPPTPSMLDTWGAAFRTQNTIGSAIANSGIPDPGVVDQGAEDFNAIDYVKDDPRYSPFVESFAGIRNKRAAEAQKLRIDQELQDQRTLSAAGGMGAIAQMAVGVVDLPTLFPVGGEFVAGGRIARAANIAIGAGLDAGVSEAALQATQATRTREESALNIGGSILLGGTLGTLVGRLGAAEARSLSKKIEGQDAAFATADKEFANLGKGTSAGAAATDTGPLVLKDEGFISKLPIVNRQDPLIRLQLNELDAGRQAVRGLAETPLEYADNAAGIATERGGAVETRMKMWHGPLASALREIDTSFARYYHSTPEPTAFQRFLSPAMSEFDRFRGSTDRLTYKQFKEEVGKAAFSGEQHPIAQVAEAARVYRKLDDAMKKAAIEAKLLPEDVAVKGDISHLFRMYNKERIIAQRDRFSAILNDHYLAAQQAAQGRVAEAEASRLAVRAQEAQSATMKLQNRLDGIEARIKEKTAAYEGTLAKGNSKKVGVTPKQFESLQARRDALDELTSEYRAVEAMHLESADRYKRIMDEFDKLPPEVAKSTKVKMALDYVRLQKQKADLSARITRLREKEAGFRLSGQIAKADDIAREINSLEFDLARATTAAGKLDKIFENTGRYFAEGGIAKDNEFAALLPGEIRSLVDDTINSILGHADSRIPYDIVAGPRGPLKERLLNIESAKIQDFLNTDIEEVLRAQVRTMSADVEIARKFGSVDMAEQFRKINDEADAKIAAATSDKARQRLEAARKAALRDLAGIRDRLRGTYALPSNPDSLVLRAGRIARNINYLRLLGGMTVSAIPDLGKVVFSHGLTSAFRDGFLPMVRNFKAFRLAAQEVKDAGTALDMVLDSRAMAMADITDDFGRHSAFERGLSSLSTRFGVVSLMAPWNATLKQFTGLVTMTNILRSAERVAAGKGTARDIRNLASSGIDADLAERIAKQFGTHGDNQDGILLANAGDWTDNGAREAFRAAVVREVDRAIVTPGQDKPLWMSTELGKAVGQFKSFGISSMQKTMLAGLQQRDAATLNGVLLSLGLGAVTYWAKMATTGHETSDDPAQWAVEALDKSGLVGWLMDANNIAEKATRGRVGFSALTGKPVSRYASRNVTGAFLGPSADAVADIFQVSGSIFAGDTTQADVHKLRKLLPANNLFYIRSLFDRVEKATNSALNIPETNKK